MDDQTATISAATNSTVKFKPTPEGMACAYLSLMFMALVPIFVGSFKSIKHHIDTRAKCQETGEQAETMTDKDAAMFPLIASVALFSFYILIKINPDLVNLALSGYFFMLGVIAIFRLLAPTTHRIFPTKYNKIQYSFLFGSKNLNDKNDTSNEPASGTTSPSESHSSTDDDLVPADVMFATKFTPSDILAAIFAGALGVWYLWTKHWVANNAFGLAFALNGIELLPVNTMKIGCILLCGLFFYDVFWVFGTDVMVSVAKKVRRTNQDTISTRFPC
uniref:Minor histocompatibility antigen H13 n=1 Tax=Aceria tosichella TaxID=561515 RepID=A0A6G1SBE2_9ACAR